MIIVAAFAFTFLGAAVGFIFAGNVNENALSRARAEGFAAMQTRDDLARRLCTLTDGEFFELVDLVRIKKMDQKRSAIALHLN